MRILIFGASGFIGKHLSKALEAKAHTVVTASLRQKNSGWESEVAKCDAVVNLAGEPIFGKRWNRDVKAAIYDSRIDGTRRIVEAMGKALAQGGHCRTLVNASAVGFYGTDPSQKFTEASPEGPDFLAFVCRDWELEAQKAQTQYGIRTVRIRTGIVLGRDGGALAKLWLPFQLGLGGPIGVLNYGSQPFSWIHVDDLVNLYVHALENPSVEGALNGTAPNPVSSRDFAKTLGHVLHRPAFIPMPAPALYALVGESAHFLTTGQWVLPQRTLESGFQFRYPQLQSALVDLARKP